MFGFVQHRNQDGDFVDEGMKVLEKRKKARTQSVNQKNPFSTPIFLEVYHLLLLVEVVINKEDSVLVTLWS